jgi:predicted Zn-dependent protease with MMP-like domain
MRVSPEQFARLVQQALADLPAFAGKYMENLAVDIEPMPTPEDCRGAEVEDPRELLGLYHGIPLTERSIEDGFVPPDRITIYQRNIERLCDTQEEIVRQVRTTVLHEIGHHFGLDEDDLEELGYD